MLKFIKGKGHHVSAERAKLQKELFTFRKTVLHGFPHRPSALAWDPKLYLLAIGTKTGLVRLYGEPGVEFYGHHSNECNVSQLFFLPGQGSLISFCDDNTLHLWEVNARDGKAVLEETKSCSLEGRLKKISTCCLQASGEHLLIGTEGGNLFLLNVATFEMTNTVIYLDVIVQNVPDDYKVNPGAVEAIAEHPTEPNKILIGYNRGLLVLWDMATSAVERTYIASQQLESITWQRDGKQFISAHNDSSYIVWNTDDSAKPAKEPNSVYGPFPCKALNKILWKTQKNGADFIIFSGGMPRASYGDKHTLTVMHGDKHQVLDFTSKIIDFFTIDNSEDSDYDNPHTLVTLVEEELVVLDLESEGWLPFHLPYLSSLHSSAITCAQHLCNVPRDTWDQITGAGNKQTAGKYTDREWPITGGKVLSDEPKNKDLLLTGHEDGTVRFWDASGVALSHLYTLKTAHLFEGEEQEQNVADEAEEWPPFRKVGMFDPYSDDPRLAVKKITMCILTRTLVVGGTAGQIVVLELKPDEIEKEIEVAGINIVVDRDNFVWKGHDQLNVRSGSFKFDTGFQPTVVLQLSPPAGISALALHGEWGLIAVGTAYGFGLLDYVQKKPVMTKCTLNPNDMSSSADTPMSRRKSFKKSLRESFRRLRKGRSQRAKRDKTPTRVEEQKQSPKAARAPEADAPSGEAQPAATSPTPAVDPKPVERQVEARSVDDSQGSVVRCLYLAQSFIVNNTTTTPTLWAGTNSGAIFVFTVSLPTAEKRSSEPVTCQLGKEIQLKHRAPVVAIQIVDHSGYPLPEPLEVQQHRAKEPDLTGNHRVLICSEEQFKVFTLPSLKPYCKFKLTAHEGSRVRKVGIAKFRGKKDSNYSEHCMTCLTNQGELSIYTVPELRRQLVQHCIKREDINGITSLLFTREGEGFYLHSPCEFKRFTISAQYGTDAACTLELPEGARPKRADQANASVDEGAENPSVQHDAQNATLPLQSDQTNHQPAQDTPVDCIKGEVVGEKEVTNSEGKVDGDTSRDDDRRDMDITLDSITDHLANLTADESTVVENIEAKCVKTQEMVMTTVTSKTIMNSTAETAKWTRGSLEVSPSVTLVWVEIDKAPLAHIDELTHVDED